VNVTASRPVATDSRRKTPLAAVIFDVDGTLYDQPPLRRAMAIRLMRCVARQPATGARTIRVLRAYRHAQETLRHAPTVDNVAAAQIRIAAERTGIHEETVAACVRRWMEEEPLDLLGRCVYPGTLEVLRTCRTKGLRLAALSDYPAEGKLRAMGMADLFDVVVSAQTPEVNAFKPNPRGLLVALERLGVTASECLYVGDRADVDAIAADAAGVRCAILTNRRAAEPRSFLTVTNYSELLGLLDDLSSAVTNTPRRLL